jgi:hypothetical protein
MFVADDENKDHLQSSSNYPSETLSIEDPLYSGNEMTNSASCFSDIGVLSLDSENVQNISTPTSPQQVSAKTCQEGTSQSNGSRECRILNNIPNSKQMAVAEEDESHVQGWRHSNDINIVVYTETDTQSALQMNDERTSGGYAHELNRKDLSGMQMEVTNYALETSSWYYIKAVLFYDFV